LEILENLSVLQNYDEESYFQTIYNIDKCILNESFSQFINEKKKYPNFFNLFIEEQTKKINFDRLLLAVAIGCFSLTSK
jgi:hypothetical protein